MRLFALVETAEMDNEIYELFFLESGYLDSVLTIKCFFILGKLFRKAKYFVGEGRL